MKNSQATTLLVTAASLVALCGAAHGQALPRQSGAPRSDSAPRIPLLPNADTDSNEMRVAPIIVCFADGTDPRYVAAVEALVKQRNDAIFGGIDYYTTSRWAGSFGSPINLRWSFVPDGVSLPGGAGEATSNSTLFATFDSAFSSQGGRATWTNRWVQAFARWAQLNGNTYTRITVGGNDWDDGAAWGTAGSSGVRGDVRIGSHPIDGVNGILAYNQFPPNGDQIVDANDAVSFFAISANQNRALRNVIMHEHGHGLGLLHSCSNNSNILMYPSTSSSPSYDGPQQDDIRSVESLYGDANGLINTVALAKDLGSISPGGTIPASGVLGTTPAPLTGSADANSAVYSLDNSVQLDYFKITATTPLALNVTATPKGSTYQNASQANDGSCPTTGTTNALAAANLIITVYASDGTTQVATANTAAAGSPEVLSNAILSNAGVYYIKISDSSFSGTQLYTLNMSATATQTAPQFTTNPQAAAQYCTGGTITFTAIANGIPAPTLKWRRNSVPLNDGGTISGTTTNTLTITPSAFGDAGVYDCVATNVNGSVASGTATVAFNDLVFTQQPQSVTVPQNTQVTFSIATSGPAPTAYQWKQDGNPIFLGNASTLQFVAQSGDEGVYTCDVTGPCGIVTSDGATLAFVTNTCYANCDGSTTAPVLTASDFTCFLTKFRAGDSYANCDGSTGSPTLTASDFTCFLTAFRAGCP
jgi:hypothetical protein